MKLLSLLCCSILVSCASAPKVKHLEMAALPPEGWTGGHGAAGAVENNWWKHLGIVALDSLVIEAWAHNHDLQAAAAAVVGGLAHEAAGLRKVKIPQTR